MSRSLRYILPVLILFLSERVSGQATPSVADSTFWQLSLPEIQNYRAFYVQEMEALQEEKQNLIQRGIEDGERLLAADPQTDVVEDVLVRLADLYYLQEKDEYLERMEAFDDALMRYERGEMTAPPEEPRLICQRSLEMYQRIIDELPGSDMMDDAIYNKAFLIEEMGDSETANGIYADLIGDYPESPYVPEAYMRLGESYFNPPLNDLGRAISFYESVLTYRESARYDEALYKLGWSYYRLSRYPEAISYFTMLVDRQPEEVHPADRTDLRDEALEYVAISFIDFGGPGKCREYIGSLGNPDWGGHVLEKLGDIYKEEKEDYQNAILAYESWLEFNGFVPSAPLIERKIVDCYVSMKDEAKAFDLRNRMFAKYRPEGEWWFAMEEESARLTAYRLSEQALRENIQSLTRIAEENRRTALYDRILELSEDYLDVFPEDLYAYLIRWNYALVLDTKKHRYEDALKEYLTISMVYDQEAFRQFARQKGLSTIKDASANAIVVADSLVQREYRRSAGMPAAEEGREELSTAENWLAMAYDNYIKLFPFDDHTPQILANAGALYYTHERFSEALRYFRTLLRHFPKSELIEDVQYSILDSYFAKKDFGSVEALAKRILASEASEKVKDKARRRLGEAIFFKAEDLAETGNAAAAADEYYRMALETRSVEFGDRALFNAGREYERIGDYHAAIRAYEHLRVTYADSRYLRDALNNLAFNYGEVGEHRKGADRYLELARLLPEGDVARDAFYNAFLFYSQAEDWQKAIDTGEAYLSAYPGTPDAPRVFFRTGECYLKLDDLSSASRVYNAFAERFPGSPMIVEAHFHLGRYYQDKGLKEEAERAFTRASSLHSALLRRGSEGNPYYAAESLFFATRIQQAAYENIVFRLPEDAIRLHRIQKESLLGLIVDQYTRVATYGTDRLPEAVFRIGEAYENYAVSWANQELPAMAPAMRAVKSREINTRATEIYSQALSAYTRAVDAIRRVLASGSPVTGEEAARADSVMATVERWLGSSGEKVSESLYRMAELNMASVNRILRAPVPGDLSEMAKLEYRSQVLMRAVRPSVEIVIEAHRRNLRVTDSLGIQTRWADASRSRVLSSVGLLGTELRGLAFRALNAYRGRSALYSRAVFASGRGATEDLVHSMINFIELSKSYTKGAIEFDRQGLADAVRCDVDSESLAAYESDIVAFSIRMADSLEHAIGSASSLVGRADALFSSTGELRYEEALTAFEDHVYYLGAHLKETLETAYAATEEFGVPVAGAAWIGVRLLRLDPEEYADRLDMTIAQMVVRTDTTWRYTTAYESGWDRVGFDMTGWRRAQAGTNGNQASPDARQLRITATSSIPGENAFYLRKEVHIPGYPVSAKLFFRSEAPKRILVNSVHVSDEGMTEPVPFTAYLNQGSNLFAVECPRARSFAMEGAALIQYIPEQVLPHEE